MRKGGEDGTQHFNAVAEACARTLRAAMETDASISDSRARCAPSSDKAEKAEACLVRRGLVRLGR